MYAIIATGGKQVKVAEGEYVCVEKLEAEVGAVVTFDSVLAISDEGTLKVGAEVKDAKVEALVVAQERAKKVVVYKYKSKKGYHKKNGHRQQYTKVKISSIQA